MLAISFQTAAPNFGGGDVSFEGNAAIPMFM